MSSTGFDTLRDRHRASASLITQLEAEMTNTLRRDPNAVIDGDILTAQLNVDSRDVLRLLLELVAEHELIRRYFWICPEGRGSLFESENIQEFPDWLDCDRCSKVHYFNQNDVEVHFLPSESLRNRLFSQT
jgi:hypothetical protein